MSTSAALVSATYHSADREAGSSTSVSSGGRLGTKAGLPPAVAGVHPRLGLRLLRLLRAAR
jgi:hypothetical protein